MAGEAVQTGESKLAGILAASGWVLLALLILPVLRESFAIRFLVPGRLGPTFWNLRAFYWGHGLLALATVPLGGLQFNGALRRRRPELHRWTGRSYVLIACVSATTGIWLAVHNEYPGWRVPLSLLGLLWLGFTLAGWLRARLRDFEGHRRAMKRSYAAALAFVSTRLLVGPLAPFLFGFIADPMLRATTAMWLGVVTPLLVLEAYSGGASLIRATARSQERARPRASGLNLIPRGSDRA